MVEEGKRAEPTGDGEAGGRDMQRMIWTVFGLLAFVAAGCSGPNRDEAKKEIERMGGIVQLSSDGKQFSIDFSNTGIQDADMPKLAEQLKAFPEVEQLNLSDTTISERGLLALKGVQCLRRLTVSEKLFGTPATKELQEANYHLGIQGPFRIVGDSIPPPK